MFSRMVVAAALVLSAGLATASDATYDQRQISEGKVTLVEGGRPSTAQQKHFKSDTTPSSRAGGDGCRCSKK